MEAQKLLLDPAVILYLLSCSVPTGLGSVSITSLIAVSQVRGTCDSFDVKSSSCFSTDFQLCL